MAFARQRPPHPLRPKLDAQPVDQPRHVARRPTAPRSGCPAPRPAARTSSPRARRHRSRTRDRAPPPCRRADAANAPARGSAWRSRRWRPRDAAVDPVAGQRQPPRAELPRLQLPDQFGHQQLERLAGRLGVRRPARPAGAALAAAARMARRSAARACGPAPGRARRTDCRPRGNGARGAAAAPRPARRWS